MDIPPYEGRVASALASFLHSKSHIDIDSLALLLGHHNGAVGPDTPADELIAGAAWVTVLRRYDQTAAAATYTEKCMLTGLLRNDRWRALFQCEKDAYAFVVVLTRYLRKEHASMTPAQPLVREAYRALRIQLHAAMADWFPPGINPADITLRDLGCALFGDAWAALVYDDCGDKITLAHLVDATRPQFLPGRLAVDVEHAAAKLPALE